MVRTIGDGGVGIFWGLVSAAIGVVVWWLGRRIAANQRRIAELEARVADLSKADHVLERAHERAGEGPARHLKLLGLIPALWMLDQVTRRPAITAAAIAATMMASGVTINTARLPMVGDKVPGVTEPAAGEEPPTSELETTRGAISATDTTATIPPPPPSAPVPESPSTTESTASPRGATTTTTTAPVPGSTTTTLEVVIDPPPLDPGELLPSCLVEADAPGLLRLCPAG